MSTVDASLQGIIRALDALVGVLYNGMHGDITASATELSPRALRVADNSGIEGILVGLVGDQTAALSIPYFMTSGWTFANTTYAQLSLAHAFRPSSLALLYRPELIQTWCQTGKLSGIVGLLKNRIALPTGITVSDLLGSLLLICKSVREPAMLMGTERSDFCQRYYAWVKPAILDLLDHSIDANASFFVPWGDFNTKSRPLHIATQCSELAIVKRLLECGADPFQCNDEGQVPGDYLDKASFEVAEVLREAMKSHKNPHAAKRTFSEAHFLSYIENTKGPTLTPYFTFESEAENVTKIECGALKLRIQAAEGTAELSSSDQTLNRFRYGYKVWPDDRIAMNHGKSLDWEEYIFSAMDTLLRNAAEQYLSDNREIVFDQAVKETKERAKITDTETSNVRYLPSVKSRKK